MVSIQGNGNIITKEIIVSSFLQLHLSISHEIEIHHSNEEKVVIEMDENLQDYIDVSNSGRTLYVTTDTGIFKKSLFTKCKVKVYYRQLNVINIANENADFDCKELLNFPNDIEINIQSVGNTKLRINAPGIKFINKCIGNVIFEGKCHFIDIKHDGIGTLNTKELIADEVVMKHRGVGEINSFANDSITISHSGVGNIFYYGSAILKDIKQHGAGIIQHKEI
ncbi:MAG: DUF2807 domain-containing protein [Bacteroidota bacterium]